MKKTTSLLFLITLSSSTPADTLKEVIQRTLETNPDVLITTQLRHAADQQLKQANAGYWPTIELTGSYGREKSDNPTTPEATLNRQEMGITLSQMLFDGFYVKNNVERQNALVNSAAHKVKNSSENIALITADVYLEILRRQQLLELSKDNVVVHQKILEQIRTLIEGGAGRQADLQQSASRLALAKSSLVNAQGNLRNAEINYRRVTGELPQALIKPLITPFQAALPETAEVALDTALSNHSSLQVANADLQAAQAAHQRAKSAFMPNFNLELSLTDNQNLDGIEGDNDDINAMLKMRYNLYRGGADQARLQEAVERIGAAKEEIRRVQRVIEEETLLAWNSLITLRARIHHLEEHVESTKQVLKAYQEQFKLGQRSLLDVLDSENELFNARASLASAQYSEILSTLKVLNSIGLLLTTIDVTPPPEIQSNS